MLKNLTMDFPILKPECADFLKDVSYEVEANQDGKEMRIQHTLKGQSFIRSLVINDEAKFSVLLLYRDSSERQHEVSNDIKIESDRIVAVQLVDIKFSYAPEIIPSIIIIKEKSIQLADEYSGLTDFWKQGDDTTIPKYSRIALAEKLKFTKGGLDNLFEIQHKESFDRGWMEVSVNEFTGDGTPPVTLFCGKDVFDQIMRTRLPQPGAPLESHSQIESIRGAIATNILCALYAYMQQLHKKEDGEHEYSGVLLAHRELLQEKINENWQDGDFNPSLAATKMQPYMLDNKILNGDGGDE